MDMNLPNERMPMQTHLHDSIKTFEFILHGELAADAVQSLEQAWTSHRQERRVPG